MAVADVWMTSKEAAEYLNIHEVHFRRSILPAMKEMKLKGMGRLGKGKSASWRFKKSTLDKYVELNCLRELLQGTDEE